MPRPSHPTGHLIRNRSPKLMLVLRPVRCPIRPGNLSPNPKSMRCRARSFRRRRPRTMPRRKVGWHQSSWRSGGASVGRTGRGWLAAEIEPRYRGGRTAWYPPVAGTIRTARRQGSRGSGSQRVSGRRRPRGTPARHPVPAQAGRRVTWPSRGAGRRAGRGAGRGARQRARRGAAFRPVGRPTAAQRGPAPSRVTYQPRRPPS